MTSRSAVRRSSRHSSTVSPWPFASKISTQLSAKPLSPSRAPSCRKEPLFIPLKDSPESGSCQSTVTRPELSRPPPAPATSVTLADNTANRPCKGHGTEPGVSTPGNRPKHNRVLNGRRRPLASPTRIAHHIPPDSASRTSGIHPETTPVRGAPSDCGHKSLRPQAPAARR